MTHEIHGVRITHSTDKTEKNMYEEASRAAEHFLSAAVTDIKVLRGGHISSSYLIEASGERYVLQNLKPSVYAGKSAQLEKMYISYSKAYECMGDKNDWCIPLWIKSREGSFFYEDESGRIWRVYGYIEGSVGDDDPYALGEGLAKLHKMLSFCKTDTAPLIAGLHDLKAHYDAYERAVKNARLRDEAVERCIEQNIDRIMNIKVREDAVVHNDARKENAVFSGGRVKAFVDIDTVSKGSRLMDIADAVRSCCYAEGVFNKALYNDFMAGYKGKGAGLIADDEERMILPVLERIRFELGLRYYTDLCNSGGYFADLTAEEKLIKARRYLDI